MHLCVQKDYVVEENEEEMGDNAAGEEEDEIIESDIELEGETVEPDNDSPQKVLFYYFEFDSIF